jgi:acetyl-CoA carboxylase biotin carboxyl carrier protein
MEAGAGCRVELSNEDVADILAVLDSLPYDEFDLQTPRFRLTLRRAPGGGWTQATQVLSEPDVIAGNGARGAQASPLDAGGPPTPVEDAGGGAEHVREAEQAGGAEHAGGAEQAGGAEHAGGALVDVRAPLPGTFYRAPRPGAEPFVEVGSLVGEDTVVGIVETMKLMNSVHAGTRGRVAEICVGNAEFAAHGATLLRIEAG